MRTLSISIVALLAASCAALTSANAAPAGTQGQKGETYMRSAATEPSQPIVNRKKIRHKKAPNASGTTGS